MTTLTVRVGRGKDAVVRAGCRLLGRVVPAAACQDDPAPVTDSVAVRVTLPRPGASPDGPRTVVAENLTKTYPGGVTGARDMSITAHAGEIVAVVGPNGAGKSTTLNMLTGLIRPTSGSATVHGVPISDVKRLAAVLGVALQTSGLDPAMTAAEHFETQAALYGVPRTVAASCSATLLGLFGLEAYANRQISQFSVGLQRRLVLALAMVHDPPVIILDEPTAGLDPQSRHVVWDLLEKLRAEGRTIIFSTQMLEEADLLAQRLYVVAEGRVVAEGTPSQLRKAYGELTIRVRVSGSLDEAAELIAAGRPQLAAARRETDCLVYSTTHDSGDAEAIMAVIGGSPLELLELSVGRPSLEDAFMRLTGTAIRPEPLLSVGAGGPLCRCG
ncbi:MAG TPA: ABC transporter ATP-binding protein [Micromonosporaceae bacterium]|nr:ABC transporter ATP-binding protein [Micromonosporaceae bacterium]